MAVPLSVRDLVCSVLIGIFATPYTAQLTALTCYRIRGHELSSPPLHHLTLPNYLYLTSTVYFTCTALSVRPFLFLCEAAADTHILYC